jgi:hypothetical protein
VRTGTAGISAVHRAGLTTWDWATLLKRVWGFDALACTGCGGRMRFIAVIKDRAVIAGIPAHIGENAPRWAAEVTSPPRRTPLPPLPTLHTFRGQRAQSSPDPLTAAK